MCAALSIVTTVGIVLVLLQGALSFFSMPSISLSEFYLSAKWHPQLGDPAFGVWPLVSGTLAITIGSAVIALPTGVLTAIYLSEYA
ncbi:MAG: phosphate ABC transporter permease subunit PstC, partial [Halanaeroarchaeum sp.]